jgi:CRISPR-associated protein Cmr4
MHVGSGNDLGLVDLPIQRESHTNFPKIEASSLKGALREHFEGNAKTDVAQWHAVQLAFGYDDDFKNLDKDLGEKIKAPFSKPEDRSFSGALAFSDARLLFFPVKSMKGIFAYVTCPNVLERFKSDLQLSEGETAKKLADSLNLANLENTVASKDALCLGDQLVLEEYAFTVTENDSAKEIARVLGEHLGIDLNNKMAVLSNDVFADFVRLYTEVITRNKIDNTKGTVAKGALFSEEYLPAESILYSLVFSGKLFTAKAENKKVFDNYQGATEADKLQSYFSDRLKIKKGIVQIGGNATLGKGIVKTKI